MALGPGQWSHQVVVGSAAGEVLFLDFRQPDAATASAASDSASGALRQVGSAHSRAACSRMGPGEAQACLGSGSTPNPVLWPSTIPSLRISASLPCGLPAGISPLDLAAESCMPLHP